MGVGDAGAEGEQLSEFKYNKCPVLNLPKPTHNCLQIQRGEEQNSEPQDRALGARRRWNRGAQSPGCEPVGTEVEVKKGGCGLWVAARLWQRHSGYWASWSLWLMGSYVVG